MLFNMTEVSELLGRDRRTVKRLLELHNVKIIDSYVSKNELIKFLKEFGEVVDDIILVDGKLQLVNKLSHSQS